MAKKFVTEEGLSQVVDAVVDAIKKVSDKQITEEKVTEALGSKIEEAIGVANVEPIKDKIKTLNGRVPVAGSENPGAPAETHTEEPPITVAPVEPI